MNKLKISFDFDSTLSEEEIHPLVKLFLKTDADIYIVTSRNDNPIIKHTDLYYLAEQIGIKKENIFFTNDAFKAATLDSLGIDYHFDDMEDECLEINSKCVKTLCLLFGLKDLGNLNYLFNK